MGHKDHLRKHWKFINVFLQFCNYLPLAKGLVLNLNKLETPSPKDAFCQVWVNLAEWFWRRRFLNFVNEFMLFRNYLPLGKGLALHLNKFESPSPNFWLKSVVLEKKMKWTDRRQKIGDQKSSLDKKSSVCIVNDSVWHVSTRLYIPCMACFTHVGSISHLYIKNLCIHHTIDVMGWNSSPVCSLSLVHITYVTYTNSITPLHTYTCPLCGFYYITHLFMGQINGYKFNFYHLYVYLCRD